MIWETAFAKWDSLETARLFDGAAGMLLICLAM